MDRDEAVKRWQSLSKEDREAALELVITHVKRKRESITAEYESKDEELYIRDEGFRGALAWVEGELIEEINWLRGWFKDAPDKLAEAKEASNI